MAYTGIEVRNLRQGVVASVGTGACVCPCPSESSM